MIFVFLEVLHEEAAQLFHLALEVRSTVPGLGGVQKLIWDVGAGLGDRQSEGLVGLELNLGQLARVNGIQDSTSVFQRTTLACKVCKSESFEMFLRRVKLPPVVAPAPTHPVLRSHASVLCSLIFSASMVA